MSSPGRKVRFGSFEVDLEASELRKRGILIKLQDQPFQVLAILVERPGAIVSREELRSRLWPDGTFVDFDHSLNSCINKLREALNDTPTGARYIETVPRKGYRFIAPLERLTALKRPSTRRVLVAGAAGIVLVVAAILIATRTQDPAMSLEVTPLTATPGVESQPAFSPDGNYVVYRGTVNRSTDLYVHQIGGATRRLTSDPALEVSPKWSPDGRSIAFMRVIAGGDPAQTNIVVVPAMGGPEQLVASTRIVLVPHFFYLDWFPDSENLAITDLAPNGSWNAIFGCNIRTGERWQITDPPSLTSGDSDPAVSPEGRLLAFTRTHAGEAPSRVYLVPLSSKWRSAGAPRLATTQYGARAPAWMPDGRDLIFAAGPQHRKRLMRIPVDGSRPARSLPFAAEGTIGLSAAVSRSGYLVYSATRNDIEIIRTELGRGGTAVGEGSPFVSSTFVDHFPEYSPDGTLVAFISNRSGSQQVWVADSQGANVRQLTSLPEEVEATCPRWSPDSRQISFAGGHSLYTIDVETSRLLLRARDLGAESFPDWSRDGRWIYVTANKTGREEIWRLPADPGAGDEMVQITRTGGVVPRVSADGRLVYYLKGINLADLWKVAAGGGEEVRVLGPVVRTNYFPVETGIYYIPRAPAGPARRPLILFHDFRSGPRMVVYQTGPGAMWGFTVSPDRRYVLHTESASKVDSDLMIVRGFR